MMEQEQVISTRPYFIRAVYEWCTDNGFTPYLAVKVDDTVQVPLEYVKNGEVVLNIGFTATSGLELENDYIRFQARFAGSARQLIIPVDKVLAIYARENGQGMAFPTEEAQKNMSLSTGSAQTQNRGPSLHVVDDATKEASAAGSVTDAPKDASKKPSLRVID